MNILKWKWTEKGTCRSPSNELLVRNFSMTSYYHYEGFKKKITSVISNKITRSLSDKIEKLERF